MLINDFILTSLLRKKFHNLIRTFFEKTSGITQCLGHQKTKLGEFTKFWRFLVNTTENLDYKTKFSHLI